MATQTISWVANPKGVATTAFVDYGPDFKSFASTSSGVAMGSGTVNATGQVDVVIPDNAVTFYRIRYVSAQGTSISPTQYVISPPAVAGTTRHVGAGQTYATVDAAIAACVAGDTIMVHAGTYGQMTLNRNMTGLVKILRNGSDTVVFKNILVNNNAKNFYVGPGIVVDGHGFPDSSASRLVEVVASDHIYFDGVQTTFSNQVQQTVFMWLFWDHATNFYLMNCKSIGGGISKTYCDPSVPSANWPGPGRFLRNDFSQATWDVFHSDAHQDLYFEECWHHDWSDVTSEHHDGFQATLGLAVWFERCKFTKTSNNPRTPERGQGLIIGEASGGTDVQGFKITNSLIVNIDGTGLMTQGASSIVRNVTIYNCGASDGTSDEDIVTGWGGVDNFNVKNVVAHRPYANTVAPTGDHNHWEVSAGPWAGLANTSTGTAQMVNPGAGDFSPVVGGNLDRTGVADASTQPWDYYGRGWGATPSKGAVASSAVTSPLHVSVALGASTGGGGGGGGGGGPLVPPVPPFGGAPQIAFTSHVGTKATQAIANQQASLAKAAGATVIREDAPWAWHEGVQGTYNFGSSSVVFRALTAAAQAGLKVVLQAGYTPPWANGNVGDDKVIPSTQFIQSYANYVRALAQFCETSFPGVVIAIEYWNEPNIQFLKNPDGSLTTGAQYTALAIAAWNTVRGIAPAGTDAAPNIELWAGATSGNGDQGTYLGWAWLDSAIAAGIVGHYNGWSNHPYYYYLNALGTDIGATNNGDPLSHTFWQAVTLISKLAAAGDSTSKVHATEWGSATHAYPSGTPVGPVGGSPRSMSEQEIANAWAIAWPQWKTQPRAGHFFLYDLVDDNTADATDEENHFGAYRDASTGYAPKPMVAKMQAAVAAVGTGSGTASGNEITDSSRGSIGSPVLGRRYDGLGADSSFGIFTPTTNLFKDGSCEIAPTPTNDWFPATGLTIALDSTTPAHSGGKSYAIRRTTLGQIDFSTAPNKQMAIPAQAIGDKWTFSVWVRAVGASAVGKNIGCNLSEFTTVGGTFVSNTSSTGLILTNNWQLLTVTHPITSITSLALAWQIFGFSSDIAAGDGINIDTIQVEKNDYPTPYIHTDAAGNMTALAPRLQFPALFTPAQGTIAFRVRAEWAYSQLFAGRAKPLLQWYLDANNKIDVWYDQAGQCFKADRYAGGAGGAVSSGTITPAAGVKYTVIVRWNATTIAISVNGAAFVSVSNTNVPASLPANMDFLTNQVFPEGWDGEVLWAIVMAGTPTDAEAATIHGYGDTDPAANLVPASPKYVWPAVTANYDIPTASQAQVGRPNSDISTGTWRTQSGSATGLFSTLDEAQADDTDYDQALATATPAIMEVKLGPMADPQRSDGHQITYRIGKNIAGGDIVSMVVRLMQGTTEIAVWAHPNVGILQTFSQTLSTAQADSITDYTNLRFRFETVKG